MGGHRGARRLGEDAPFDVLFPVTPGWDVSGVVYEVGPAVTGLAVGDEVFGYLRKDALRGGTCAEKVSAPDRYVARSPPGSVSPRRRGSRSRG